MKVIFFVKKYKNVKLKWSLNTPCKWYWLLFESFTICHREIERRFDIEKNIEHFTNLHILATLRV